MDYLADKVSTFDSDRFECPATDCPVLIEDILGIGLVESNPRIVAKNQKVVSEVFVEMAKYLRWCPGPDSSLAIRDRTHGALTGVNCSECHDTFCCACDQEWHDPLCCRLLKTWKQKAADDVATSAWLVQHSKPRPKCAMSIEKNASCGYEFCWIRLGTWRPHDLVRCSTYSVSEANKDASHESKALVERYMFHQDRFKAYQESLRLEQALKPQMHMKVEKMKALEMNRFEAETPRQAWETLLKCRRMLMWTFVFAYFLKNENEHVGHGSNRNYM
ncbi:hypothetical protein RvY_02151 [Ramazzottius varieornatus]|uniref:RBR-type E3 ubiquitin transferase n=1 Tax=Ramazzottius varieornatus TaxID=947166 RepID=A0A1D1UJK2_RAMVA|nr:hypothetical protein RvY_02151 [Ramazzottius varieornatus]